jgi:4-amino-4-deoxy-L-arabinose transferase-like glycosyltransferase
MTAAGPDRRVQLSDTTLLISLSLVALAAQLLSSGRYGYFRDEFYYFACGEHLDWGYVDQPPFVALVAYLVRRVLGELLLAIRLLPAVCNGLVVFLTGLMARELGGGRFAQALAALATLIAPVYLIIHHVFSMNCFDHVLWAFAAYLLIRLLKEDRPKIWVLFGLVAGVGLMNKYSVGFLGMGLVVGLVLTPARRHLVSKWLWLGGAIAFFIFLPHILWQVEHGFPTREFIHNATLYKNLAQSPPAFLAESILQVHPLTLPLWLAGLYFCFFAREGRSFRVLGWIYAAVLVLFLATNAKPYYLAPAYYMLFAAGAVAVESFNHARQWNWLKPASATALIAGGLLTLPYALPVLPVETFIRYQNWLGLRPGSGERGPSGELPQMYADMFGWENQVATVAKVYHSLPPEEKSRTIIYCSNYGQAGAIDFLGEKYGLPKAASGHNNYWLWGPGNWEADIVITVGESPEDVASSFHDVQEAAMVISKYARPSETNLPIYIGRKPKYPLKEIWPRAKQFI